MKKKKTPYANMVYCLLGARVFSSKMHVLHNYAGHCFFLFNLGSNAMLVVMGYCAKNVEPDRLLKKKPNNIKCFTNILIWKEKAYKCDLNRKACKEIKGYCSNCFPNDEIKEPVGVENDQRFLECT